MLGSGTATEDYRFTYPHSQVTANEQSQSIKSWQATTAENLIGKAYSLCQSGGAALPAEISKPILDGCKNATDVVKKIPREVPTLTQYYHCQPKRMRQSNESAIK